MFNFFFIRSCRTRPTCLACLACLTASHSRRYPRIPAVSAANFDQETQHVVPRRRLHHRCVREHAAVPADVIERLRDLALLVAHPQTGMTNDVELAVRIGGQAMAAGL